MKMIVAYIKEHMLENVSLALHKIDGLTGMSIANYKGFGRSRGGTESEERLEDGFDFLPCIKIEITCENRLVEKSYMKYKRMHIRVCDAMEKSMCYLLITQFVLVLVLRDKMQSKTTTLLSLSD